MALGDKVNKLFDLRNAKKQLESKVREINEELEKLEYFIIEDMKAADLEQVKTELGTVSKKSEMYPKVVDKDAFVRFAVAQDHMELLQLQANRKAYKEYFEIMGEYPAGTDTYLKESLSVRAKSSK